MSRLHRKKAGFSLIELMIAALILSFLGGVIYALLSQGIEIWHRSITPKPSFEIDLFLEKLESELRNISSYDQAGSLVGEKDRIEFFLMANQATLSRAQFGGNGGIVKVSYRYDPYQHGIQKTVFSYADLLMQSTKPSVSAIVLTGFSDCRFEFLGQPGEEKEADWFQKWDGPCIPHLVKVSFAYKEGARLKQLSQLISVPMAGCVQGAV